MTCIVCPMGCTLITEKNGDEIKVTGNGCPRGERYAISELTAPVRTLTTVVKTDSDTMLSVKSAKPLPKDLIIPASFALASTVVKLPVKIGDIIYENILDSGIDIVATKNLK